MDRRSEGELSQTSGAKKSRADKKLRAAKGLCTYCGVTEVLNRSTCYSCSDKQAVVVQLYGARKTFKQHGIDDFAATIAALKKLPSTAELKKIIAILTALIPHQGKKNVSAV